MESKSNRIVVSHTLIPFFILAYYIIFVQLQVHLNIYEILKENEVREKRKMG